MIQDSDINPAKTEELKNNPKYQRYLKWVRENGLIANGVDFPVAFGSLGYLGLAANKDIPPYTAFLALPNKLFMNVEKLMAIPELAKIIKENEATFSEKDCLENDIKKLTLWVMYEKNKGEKSFWFPYFDIIDESYTILSWTDQEMQQCDSDFVMKLGGEFKERVGD